MMAYLSYTIMGKCLIVYLKFMSLKTWMTVHLPYMSDMSFQDMVHCMRIVQDYEGNVLLYTSRV